MKFSQLFEAFNSFVPGYPENAKRQRGKVTIPLEEEPLIIRYELLSPQVLTKKLGLSVPDERWDDYLKLVRNSYEISFSVNDSFEKTGDKKSERTLVMQIFSTVLAEIKKLMKENPSKVYYFDSKDLSRTKLYKALIKRFNKAFVVRELNLGKNHTGWVLIDKTVESELAKFK